MGTPYFMMFISLNYDFESMLYETFVIKPKTYFYLHYQKVM